MYPVVRLTNEIIRNRKAGPVALGETHLTNIRVWPWDIDVFFDLNNGRILTLMDLGRFGYFARNRVIPTLKKKGWYGTVAGSVIRYRRRITMFQRLELRTRVLGWDARFTYFDQGFWHKDQCCAHAVVRTAITDGKGIVPSKDVAELLGFHSDSPALPDWVRAWDGAEQQRPWPPS